MKKNSSVGRRKTAIARVFITKGSGKITINGKDYKNYFPIPFMQDSMLSPLKTVENETSYDFKVNVGGGGIKGQVEAVRLGIARALLIDNEEYRPALKKARLLTRDARIVERKKTGLRGARRREQYSKR
ncbi:MAG: 30S ribosomal protein S9 [Bacteroidetes bacterium]|nr:30S ribosomal protein S9 [Bacteroidota bacterium]MBP7477712.1 30S ribosomal protein S9 [Chitinophagales bacterium]